MTADCLIVVIGDSPRLQTGLSRIARDITSRLWASRERLGTHVAQMAWEPRGMYPLSSPPWPLVTFADLHEDWGAGQVVPYVGSVVEQLGVDPHKVVLFTVWDPARCFEYRYACENLWGYFAVDGHNMHGRFGGPAADTVAEYARVLAYTEYGAQVLHDTIAHVRPDRQPVIPYLPHGHEWNAAQRADAVANCVPPLGGWRLGCVATNQPRKDLGLFFAVLRTLLDLGEPVQGWLHTDAMVTGAWSIPELLEVYNITEEQCLISTGNMTDSALQELYASCAVTLAPGRGEGFGYPIVESYAMGRPVVHCDYGGGRELTLPEGRSPVDVFDTTNPYVIQRPILGALEVAQRCEELAHKLLDDPTLATYYAGTVAHLHWDHLWPRWETWVRQGLREMRNP